MRQCGLYRAAQKIVKTEQTVRLESIFWEKERSIVANQPYDCGPYKLLQSNCECVNVFITKTKRIEWRRRLLTQPSATLLHPGNPCGFTRTNLLLHVRDAHHTQQYTEWSGDEKGVRIPSRSDRNANRVRLHFAFNARNTRECIRLFGYRLNSRFNNSCVVLLLETAIDANDGRRCRVASQHFFPFSCDTHQNTVLNAQLFSIRLPRSFCCLRLSNGAQGVAFISIIFSRFFGNRRCRSKIDSSHQLFAIFLLHEHSFSDKLRIFCFDC